MFKRSLQAISLALMMLLVLSLVSADADSSSARATQSRKPLIGTDEVLLAGSEGSGFVLQEVDGSVLCRDATPEESMMLQARDEYVPLHVISPLRDNEISPADAGLQIILRGTPQLENFQAAKNAFLRAAERWEALIQNPITVIIDVDFGPTRFGQAYPNPNTLGSTSSQWIGSSTLYAEVRRRLIEQASSQRESGLYNALPTSAVPTDMGNTAGILAPSALFRALGMIRPVADPAVETATLGVPPAMGFNSAFAFDFDPGDGIDSTKTDFDAVAVHEIGHALGFSSTVGSLEVNPGSALAVGILDLFRMRPGVTLASFPGATRIQSSGGTQVFFAATSELALSTGRTNGTGGDGRQASHWKDDDLTGQYLGIMDPVINRGTRYSITNNDLLAFDSFGYQIRSAAGNTVPLNSGVSQRGSISAPQNESFLLSATQYSIQVPNGATELKTGLNGNPDVDLYIRFGQRVDLDPSGRIIADYGSESETGAESVIVAGSSSPPLNPGTYYIAVANFGPGAATYDVTATVTGGASGNNAPRITDLQADLRGDELVLTGTVVDTDGDITQAQSGLFDGAGQKVGQTEPFQVSFGSSTTVNFRLSVTNLNSLPAAMLTSLTFFDRAGNRSTAATADFSNSDSGGPTIGSATLNGNKLVIKGSNLAGQLQIEINGQVVVTGFSDTDRKLKVKGDSSRLNLRAGPNRLRIINGSLRSNLFVLIV